MAESCLWAANAIKTSSHVSWTVYLLQTRSRDPIRVYAGRTPTCRREIRLQEHIDGGSRASGCCRQYGVSKLIYWEEVPSEMHAQQLEERWAEDLAFIFETEKVRVSNGIERWSIRGRLETNWELNTGSDYSSLSEYKLRFNYDRLPPRDLLHQRKIWRYRVMNPLRVFDCIPMNPSKPIPTTNQMLLL